MDSPTFSNMNKTFHFFLTLLQIIVRGVPLKKEVVGAVQMTDLLPPVSYPCISIYLTTPTPVFYMF